MFEVGLVGLQVKVFPVTNQESFLIEVASSTPASGHILNLNMQLFDGGF